MHNDIKEKAIGRWRSILPAVGISPQYLSGKHGACPCCGGKDRFRFDDKNGTGSYYCNGCGAGSGIDLVMKVKKINFAQAAKEVEAVLPSAPVQIAKPGERKRFDPQIIWDAGHKIERHDPVGKYLAARGLPLDTYPTQLRFHPRVRYAAPDEAVGFHPAMLAKFVSPDTRAMTLHMTFLTVDGQKAPVKSVRLWWKGPIPKGGAIRLSSSAETMGVAEGIETAMSAAALFGMPVWAAANAGNLAAWQPPPTARQVVVFADNDANAAGQAAAWSLAHRLRISGYQAKVEMPSDEGQDWNDVWMEVRK